MLAARCRLPFPLPTLPPVSLLQTPTFTGRAFALAWKASFSCPMLSHLTFPAPLYQCTPVPAHLPPCDCFVFPGKEHDALEAADVECFSCPVRLSPIPPPRSPTPAHLPPCGCFMSPGGARCTRGSQFGNCADPTECSITPPSLPHCPTAPLQEEHDALEAANVESVLENVPFVDSVSLAKHSSFCAWLLLGLSMVLCVHGMGLI